MTRYDMVQRGELRPAMASKEDGDWVLFSDVQSALAQRDEEIARLKAEAEANVHVWRVVNAELRASLSELRDTVSKL